MLDFSSILAIKIGDNLMIWDALYLYRWEDRVGYPQKWGAEPPRAPQNDLHSLQIRRMTSQPIKIIPVSHGTSPSLRNSYSKYSILIPKNKYMAFTSTKKTFFSKNLNVNKKFTKIHKQFVLQSHVRIKVAEAQRHIV